MEISYDVVSHAVMNRMVPAVTELELQGQPAAYASARDQQTRMHRLLRQYRRPNNTSNIRYLVLDLVSLAVVMGLAIALCEWHAHWGVPALACVPPLIIAVVLIGAIQHRLAGLGHEASHHVLFRNRWLNELAADWLCMFPIFTTTDHYRSLHLGHHRWVNDHDRDPEFQNLGRTRQQHVFPMSRGQFVIHFLSRILWPFSLLRYSWENMLHSSIGVTQRGAQDWPILRPLFVLAVSYGLAVTFALRFVAERTAAIPPTLLAAVACSLVAAIAIWMIPEQRFYRSGYPGCYGPRLRSWMRLSFFIALQGTLAIGSLATGTDWPWYFRLFWVLPLLTGFPYFMLLRDAYQHANTDEGRYTNSRVMYPDLFSRWAIFMYGSDIHLTHHLHPSVPHYKLRRLHKSLKRRSKQYAEDVIETHGMFRRARPDYPCLIETIEGNF